MTGVSPGSYLDRLGARLAAVGNCLCLGLDPDPDSLPPGFSRDVAGVERFGELVLEAGIQHAAAVKANLAFFEAFGSRGLAALERLRGRVRDDVPFIADAKRADIGSTAARQSVAIFEALGADAVTVNPYLGLDAVEPFLERPDRFAYVLCRTSNEGAGELQGRLVSAPPEGEPQPLFLHVAQRVSVWAQTYPRLGLVVGATGPAEMSAIRAAVPELAFLVPGLGTQGGDLESVRRHGPASGGPLAGLAGGALLVNVSRAIAGAATSTRSDAQDAIAAAALRWAEALRC